MVFVQISFYQYKPSSGAGTQFSLSGITRRKKKLAALSKIIVWTL